MSQLATADVAIIGGGIIGLSLAYELARSGRKVHLLDRQAVGKEASWAGAGMLPPGSWFSDHAAAEALAALSQPLHAQWSASLRELTGVDDQWQRMGGLYAITPGTRDDLQAKFSRWKQQGITVERLSTAQARGMAPEFVPGDAYFVPEEAQVRNPRRLKALRAGCERLGVTVSEHTRVISFEVVDDRVALANTSAGPVAADNFCLTAGAWTGGLVEQLEVSTSTKPYRGQLMLLKLPRQVLSTVYHQAGNYIVPRRDGHVLIGATLEDVGFDKRTRQSELNALVAFAHRVAPCLKQATVEKSWAGLRPGSPDGLPMIGPLPGYQNAWIASGHFRSGLQFAPATALIMRRLLDGELPGINPDSLSPGRFQTKNSVPTQHTLGTSLS